MGEIIPLFPKDRRKRQRGSLPPPAVGELTVLVTLRNRDFNASCRELAEIAAGVTEALSGYRDSMIMDCGFAKEHGEA